MRRSDWSLVIFTLLVQMSVGTFVLFVAYKYFTSTPDSSNALNSITDSVMDVSILVLVLGVIAAFFHLRKPNNIYFSFLNFRSSWLSRETLLGLTFGLVLVIFGILHWFQIGSVQLRNTLEIVVLISGVILVYAMSRVYMIRTVPSWNNIFTPTTFFTTTLLLGTLSFGAVWIWHLPMILNANIQPSLVETYLGWIKGTSAVLVGLQILWVYRSYRKYAPRNEAREWAKFRIVLLFRIALGVIGIAFLYNVTDLQFGGFEHAGLRVLPLTIAFLLVLASEILGRFLFYASHKRVGL